MDAQEWTALFDRAATVGATEADVRATLAAVRAPRTDAADDGGADE